MAFVNKEEIYNAYEDVRKDNSETNWLLLGYDNSKITLDSTGVDFSDFKSKFNHDQRLFGFVRIETGDEMSIRRKFAFVTFIGQSVGVLKRAKVSTDKGLVKDVINSFAVEILTNEVDDITEDNIREQCMKAGGANYGTGKRD